MSSRQDRFPEAITAAEAALAFVPKTAEPQARLARIYQAMGRADEARQ